MRRNERDYLRHAERHGGAERRKPEKAARLKWMLRQLPDETAHSRVCSA
jgi:hypothetical protein